MEKCNGRDDLNMLGVESVQLRVNDKEHDHQVTTGMMVKKASGVSICRKLEQLIP